MSVFGFGQMDHAPQIDGPSPKDGAALGKTLVHRLLEPLSDGAMVSDPAPGSSTQYCPAPICVKGSPERRQPCKISFICCI